MSINSSLAALTMRRPGLTYVVSRDAMYTARPLRRVYIARDTDDVRVGGPERGSSASGIVTVHQIYWYLAVRVFVSLDLVLGLQSV